MKLALIAPSNSLDISEMGDMQFALAHVVDDKYWDYFRQCSEYLILDNGSFEVGHSVSFERLMEIAERIGASEVVAPDTQFDSKSTLINTAAFIEWFREQGYDTKFKVMAVVWADGPYSISTDFAKYKELKPDTYGFGKWIEGEYWYGTRAKVIENVIKKYGIKPEQIHALGCPYAKEITLLRGLVRSLDTGLACKAAIRGVRVTYLDSIPLLPTELRDLTPVEHKVAVENAKTLLRLAHGTHPVA